MDYGDVVIKFVPPMEAIRTRPRMYFGKPREHPQLPGGVLRWVVEDALTERTADEPLRVHVVVATDRQFSVTDNGPGLPASVLPDLTTTLKTGTQAPRGTNLAIATALCSSVVAETWSSGQHCRQRVSWTGPLGPTEELGPTDKHGTCLTYRLDDEYFSRAAAIPEDIPGLLADLNRAGGQLEIADLRQRW